LASTIFCAIIAIGYSQDLGCRGWAHAEPKKETDPGCSSSEFGWQGWIIFTGTPGAGLRLN
jgi:hypothetical protein